MSQYISKHNDSSKIKKILLETWKLKWDKENPFLFLEDLEMRWCKNGVWGGWHGLFRSVSVEREVGKTVNSHKNLREKLKKFLKNCLRNTKHAFFVIETSHQDTRQNTSSQKIWKNLLSVFHDWKSHSRGSCELSRENLCVPLATGPFTC